MPSAKQIWKLDYNNSQIVIIALLAKKSMLQIYTNATAPATTQSWKERLMQFFKPVMRVK